MMFGKDAVWGGTSARTGGGPQMHSPLMSGPSSMMGSGIGASPTSGGGMLGGGDKPPLCKYFVNGGCLRGDQCTYLHELPDERHLDVNGLGFIFKSNVHNAQKTVNPSSTVPTPGGGGGGVPSVAPTSGGVVMPSSRKPGKRVIPRYRPPEPVLEHNLPPALAIPFGTTQPEVLQTLLSNMMDGANLALPTSVQGSHTRM